MSSDGKEILDLIVRVPYGSTLPVAIKVGRDLDCARNRIFRYDAEHGDVIMQFSFDRWETEPDSLLGADEIDHFARKALLNVMARWAEPRSPWIPSFAPRFDGWSALQAEVEPGWMVPFWCPSYPQITRLEPPSITAVPGQHGPTKRVCLGVWRIENAVPIITEQVMAPEWRSLVAAGDLKAITALKYWPPVGSDRDSAVGFLFKSFAQQGKAQKLVKAISDRSLWPDREGDHRDVADLIDQLVGIQWRGSLENYDSTIHPYIGELRRLCGVPFDGKNFCTLRTAFELIFQRDGFNV